MRATVVNNPIYHSPLKDNPIANRLSDRVLTLGTLAINFSSNVSASPDASKTDNGSNTNALRHTMIMALIGSKFGRDFAEATGQSHEASIGDMPEFPLSYVFDNDDASDSAIDIRNNHAGVDIGAANPDATPMQLAFKVLEWAATKGLYKAVEIEGGNGKVVEA
ncbi:hypothetical protein BKA63DRAFT_583460 [Paraphoma chrysanthemicola]|nr:hypothetical protein BKA63DRAFT_583460 [Paraphoma chrysanthemicola]